MDMNGVGEGMADTARVLVVDDSRVMRKAIVQILRQDFQLDECEDGERAWELLQEGGVDLVISDVEMPRLDGYGLLGRLRSWPRTDLSDIPVIVITGAEDEPTKQRALDAGASDFIVKPIDRIQLLARVRNQVRLERANRALAERVEERTLEDVETGLGNKRALLQRGAIDLAFARRHGRCLAVIRFNLALAPGSHPLSGIAGWLRTRVRQEETLAHLGGGAFAILAPCQDAAEATALGERLRRELAQAHLSVGASLSQFAGPYLAADHEDIGEVLAMVETQLEPVAAFPAPPVPPEPPARAVGQQAAFQIEPLPSLPASAPSLEEALVAIRAGRIKDLRPHLKELVVQTLPLLELCNQEYALGLAFALRSLREKLS